MKKIGKLTICVPCILFFAWYIIVSYANVYACDDYWHGANVHSFGFWNAQVFYWNNWEGSFTHTFLATLPHIFQYERMPFVCNILSLLLLLYSTDLFIKTYFQASKYRTVVYAGYLVAFLLTFTTGEAEIRYWVCANNAYLFGISTTLLLLSLYHRFDFTINKTALWLILILIAIVGNKISFIYWIVLALLFHDVIYDRLSVKHFFIILFFVSAFSLLNILAPGNFIRLSQNMEESAAYGMTIGDSILYRIESIVPFFFASILLLPICISLHLKVTGKNIIIQTIALFLLFIGDTAIMFICFQDSGPKRGNIILEVSVMFYICSLLCYLMMWLKSNRLKTILQVASCLIFACYNIGNILHIEESYEYSRISHERDYLVIKSEQKEKILIPALPNSGLLLSYFCNEEVWIENVYLEYFNKKMRVEIISNDGN